MQGLIAGGGVFDSKHGRGQHQTHQHAGACHHIGPVGVTNGAQGHDCIAHTQVVGGLFNALLALLGGGVGQRFVQPLLKVAVHVGFSSLVKNTLCHLREEDPAHTALPQQCQQSIQQFGCQALPAVAAQIGHFTGGLVGGHTFSQAAQVLDQHHPQGGGQRPQLPQIEFAPFLVGSQKMQQQVFVESTVGVRNKRPGHAIHTRQTGQGFAL